MGSWVPPAFLNFLGVCFPIGGCKKKDLQSDLASAPSCPAHLPEDVSGCSPEAEAPLGNHDQCCPSACSRGNWLQVVLITAPLATYSFPEEKPCFVGAQEEWKCFPPAFRQVAGHQLIIFLALWAQAPLKSLKVVVSGFGFWILSTGVLCPLALTTTGLRDSDQSHPVHSI